MNNATGASAELNIILNDLYGYRNDQYNGSGSFISREVIEFECFELDNDDIVLFCEKYFNEEYLLLSKREKVDAIISVFCDNYPYALWVTTFSGVKTRYSSGHHTEISCYNLHNTRYLAISDLGTDGVLILLDQHPSTIKVY